jgi:hypothetical protein
MLFDQSTGESGTEKETPMTKVERNVRFLFVLAVLLITGQVRAGVPLNNVEGVGGIAFNPLAYPANSDATFDPNGIGKIFGKPQIGAWYVNLGESHINWTSFSVSETFFKRLELSYGHEIVFTKGGTINKDNLGTKFLIIKENAWDTTWVPAFSIGFIGKHTKPVSSGIDSTGYDFYLVASKLITQSPWPVLLSGGMLSTNGRATGVLGYDDERDETLFGNIDVLPRKDLAFGFEYKQGAEFSDFKNADYWDLHLAWFVNKNLTLVTAYVNSGDEHSSSHVGFGDGVVLSVQYAF